MQSAVALRARDDRRKRTVETVAHNAPLPEPARRAVSTMSEDVRP
jgi:hypothetical protein